MPSIRATLISNVQQNRQTVTLFASSPVRAEDVYKLAKSKLDIKKPLRIFDGNGRELTPVDAPAGAIEVVNGMTLPVSTTVDYIGVKKETANDNAASTSTAEVILIANETPVKPEALAQLHSATLPDMRLVAGMPDLHAGSRKFPVGAAFVSRARFYPSLVGGDIGCGMLLLRTRIDANTNVDRLAVKLRGIGVPEGLDGEWTHGVQDWRRYCHCSSSEAAAAGLHDLDQYDRALGTIGGGNHFAEITAIEKVYDERVFSELGLDINLLLLFVHSGSRGLGSDILSETEGKELDTHGSVLEDSELAQVYLKQHDLAVRWARANRLLIAHRVLALLGERGYQDGPESLIEREGRQVLDVCHNRVDRLQAGEVETLGLSGADGAAEQEPEAQRIDSFWIHRKGAAPSTEGLIVIPGSRGSLSYIALPINDGRSNALSLAHGAGRSLSRHKAHALMSRKYGEDSKITTFLERTSLGGRVICTDRSLLYEEAPEAYKDEAQVVRDLEAAGAIRVVMTLKPVVSFKTSR
ncbi:hypothetical protein V8E36_003935 [Tilletia maclaganii]